MFTRVRRWLRRAAAIVGIVVVLALVGLYLADRTRVALPAPIGPFAVGRVTDYWTDGSRADALAESGAPRTELAVWMWYPTWPVGVAGAPYQPTAWREALGANQGPILRLFVFRDPRNVDTHSVVGGVLAPGARYPVVILRAGLGGLTLGYSSIAESLASRGYVVIGFDAPYRTGVFVTKDGQTIRRPANLNPETLGQRSADALLSRLQDAWASDIAFVGDRVRDLDASSRIFGGRLDVDRLAVVGHSLGGASALEFCRRDARCAAAVDLDGAVYGELPERGVPRPTLYVASDRGEQLSEEDQRVATDLHSVFDHSAPDSRIAVTLVGASHFNFSDQILLMNPLIRWIPARHLAPERALTVTSELVAAFLDAHLMNKPADKLEALAAGSDFRRLF